MCLNVEKYRHAFHPKDIFDLLPRDIISQMIRGFFYHIRKGVTLLWNEYDAQTGQYVVIDDRLDPFNYAHPEDRQFFNLVCWAYREKCGDRRCCNEDIRIAQAYTDGEMKEFQRYPCWLGMTDQSYGVVIGEHVRAVLFAGQIIPDNPEQRKEIERRINQYAQSKDAKQIDAEEIVGLLPDEVSRQRAIGPDYADELKKRLCEFGKMLEDILTRLFEAKRNVATQELLQRSEAYLASAGFDNPDAWWDKCARLTESFAALVGLEQIDILTRTESVYEQRLPRGIVRDPMVTAQDVLTEAAGRLASASDDESTARLAERLKLPVDSTKFYVSHSHAGAVGLSTLIVFRGQLAPEFVELATSFCRIVSQRIDFFSLVAWQRQSQEKYRMTVAKVAHDFRTPLHVIVCDLEDVEKIEQVRNDPIRRKSLARSIQRAMAAEEHVQRLISTSVPRWQPVNLAWLMGEVIEDLHPMAHNHPCKLVRYGVWPEEAWVRGDRHQLTRAMTNLVENAIKYSFGGRLVAGSFELYTVRVSLDSRENNMVRVKISNFGVGIPPAMIEKIRSPGGRALVQDERRERPGTGLGLPSAIGILEEHGGWLSICSSPADNGPRLPEEEFHRYVTRVEAYLPRTK